MNRAVWIGATAGVLVLLTGIALWPFAAAPEHKELVAVSTQTTPAATDGQVVARGGVDAQPSVGDPTVALAPAVGTRQSTAGAGSTEKLSASTGASSQTSAASVPGRVHMLDSAKVDVAALQAELQRLTAQGRQPQPREVDAVLAKLEASGARSIGGYDIQALRTNLQVADRIQILAYQMQDLAKNPTPQTNARLQEKLQEIQQLQRQIKVDFIAKGEGR